MPTSNSYRITEFGRPLALWTEETTEPQGTEVLVRVTGCGMCHTDLHVQDGYFDLGGGRKTRVGGQLPFTPGHEIVGEVAALGSEARGVEVGAKRVVYPWIGCGEPDCPECSRRAEHMCGKRALGMYVNGGYADYVLAPHPRYLVAYDGLPAPLASTCACSGLTAFSALKKIGRLGPNQKLLLIGAGGVGMSGVRMAKVVTGAAPIVADMDAAKREAALASGAAETFDPMAQDAGKLFLKTCGPVTAAIDFVGAESTVRFASGVLGKGGKLVIVGLFGGTLQTPIPIFPLRGITLQGSMVGSLFELQEVIALVKHRMVAAIPYATRPLAEAAQTLADLRAGKIVGRVVLTP